MSSLKKLLVSMGAFALETIREHGSDRTHALNITAHASLEAFENDENAKPFAALAPSFALAWAECGFPVIEPSHKLAASLMTTTMPREYVDEFVRMPWRCFGIVCPSGLLEDFEVFVLALQARDGKFKMLTIANNHIGFGTENSLAEWYLKLVGDIKIGDDVVSPDSANYEKSKSRLLMTEMLGRLFVGVCAEIGNRSDEGRPGIATATVANRTTNEPKAAVFKLMRPVVVDARRAVRDYVEGRAHSSPTVQVLVRGHWKLQPHGENRSLRKLIHVEPYWRGPDDAPIGVRSHVLKEKP